MSIRKAALLLAAATALSTSALAADNSVGNPFQVNWANSLASAQVYGGWVGTDLRGVVSAVGNNFSSYTEGDTEYYNNQLQMGVVGAQLDVGLKKGVGGDVDLQVTAICNNASISNAGGHLAGNSEQRCGTTDPYAIANVSLQMVLGDTTIGATSVSNNFEANSEGGTINAWVSNQINVADNIAHVNAEVGSTNGSFEVNATAIGNNVSIHQTR